MKVKIYCLLDPKTCKIRYIGRTSKKVLHHRLIEHVTKSKYYEKYHPNKKCTYKVNWIRSLLNEGLEPKIKLLIEVDGWKESHIFERNLINKYKSKLDLTNLDDRGEGNKNKIVSKEDRVRISESLKKYFKEFPQKKKAVFVYHRNGEFYKEFESSAIAEKELNISGGVINKKLSRQTPTTRLQWQFSRKKVEKMPDITNTVTALAKSVKLIHKYTKEEKIYLSIRYFIDYYAALFGLGNKQTSLDVFIKAEKMLPIVYLYDIYLNNKLYKLPFKLEIV